MSWRDGFTEQMFIRFQYIIDFVCTQLHCKKTTKKILILMKYVFLA